MNDSFLSRRGDEPPSYVELLQLHAANDRLTAERDRLSAQNAQMREALEAARGTLASVKECLGVGDNCDLECLHNQDGNCILKDDDTWDMIDAALSTEPIDYHNPADTARIAELEKAIEEHNARMDILFPPYD